MLYEVITDLVGEAPVVAHRRVGRQPVLLAEDEVVLAVAGRRVYRAGAGLEA